MFQRGLYILFLTMFLSSLYGQSHYLLSRLEATRHENRIILGWAIKQGGSCFGIGILRSSDNTHFEKIGEISGVCGSTESEQVFTFTDEQPIKNKINYYKLELGFSGKTEPALTVDFFDFARNASFVIPNPFKNTCKIKFINTSPGKYSLQIYENNGKFISTFYSEKDEFYLDEDFAATLNTSYPSTYVYTILDPNGQKVSSGILAKL